MNNAFKTILLFAAMNLTGYGAAHAQNKDKAFEQRITLHDNNEQVLNGGQSIYLSSQIPSDQKNVLIFSAQTTLTIKNGEYVTFAGSEKQDASDTHPSHDFSGAVVTYNFNKNERSVTVDYVENGVTITSETFDFDQLDDAARDSFLNVEETFKTSGKQVRPKVKGPSYN